MKIGVLGATGPLGLEVVRLALERSNGVVALVRNPDKLPADLTTNERLSVRKVDIFDSATMEPEFAGLDAVISCLGVHDFKSYFVQCTLYSTSIKAIAEAMTNAKVKRLVVCSSWGVDPAKPNSFFLQYILKPLFLGSVLRDMRLMETILAKDFADNICHTSVRPPGLNNGQKTGAVYAERDVNFLADGAYQMPRADVAAFMLDSLVETVHENQCVAIGIKK